MDALFQLFKERYPDDIFREERHCEQSINHLLVPREHTPLLLFCCWYPPGNPIASSLPYEYTHLLYIVHPPPKSIDSWLSYFSCYLMSSMSMLPTILRPLLSIIFSRSRPFFLKLLVASYSSSHTPSHTPAMKFSVQKGKEERKRTQTKVRLFQCFLLRLHINSRVKNNNLEVVCKKRKYL
jgi:hypothetical protein